MEHVFIGELLGTMILIVFGCGVVANVLLTKSKGHAGGWITIATGWFVGVTMGIFVAQSTGSMNGDINPAVSFAKFLLGVYSLHQMLIMMAGQLIGAFIGAILVWLSYLPHWRVTQSQDDKLMVFSTVPAIRARGSNLICEIIATALLVIGVGAVFGPATSGHPVVGMGPYLVGILVWGIGVSLGGPTGYAINPARDLGPRLAHAVLPIAGKGKSDWQYAWVPILGPMIGASIGALVWHLFIQT